MEASPVATPALGASSDLPAAAMVDLTRPDDAEDALLQQARGGLQSAEWPFHRPDPDADKNWTLTLTLCEPINTGPELSHI